MFFVLWNFTKLQIVEELGRFLKTLALDSCDVDPRRTQHTVSAPLLSEACSPLQLCQEVITVCTNHLSVPEDSGTLVFLQVYWDVVRHFIH